MRTRIQQSHTGEKRRSKSLVLTVIDDQVTKDTDQFLVLLSLSELRQKGLENRHPLGEFSQSR